MDPVLVLFVLATATLFPLTIRAQTDTLQRSGTRPSCDTSAWNCPLVDSTGAFADSSTAITSSSLYGSLSASYASSSNWNGQNLRNFALVGNLLYTHSLFAAKHGHLHQVMADLGYQKFVDSTWVKSIDRLQVNLLWNKTSRKFNSSYSIAFGTQFMPDAVPEYDPEQDKTVERSVGGFLNPFNLQLGYGLVFSFWEKSNINFAFATLQMSSSPKATTSPAFTGANVIEGKKAYYFMNYGFSVSTAINKNFGEHIQWINNTRIFGNGLDRDHVNLQFSNMVIVKLWKYLQLRFDTRLAYSPMLNYKMQFRQEALIGFFYERNK
ncbi:MAG: hypothetical protein IPO60_15025 [Flavobacteriales bacterium]|nr:hypothetical protein [Flavobacteriales bacterium]MBK6894636.1 hypothetical protein [Flavobacteriales bacterium]MBK9058337.1 hypothetical protein [Flavobacteriales bacterium]MBK9599577.1 hypothetical protein [Flavobacteriales bacterium]HQV40073.1 hypothetical protein [Flavobacteriales bacterium]